MELTDSTINILKNYATINPNIVVENGNTLKTISVARNLFHLLRLLRTSHRLLASMT